MTSEKTTAEKNLDDCELDNETGYNDGLVDDECMAQFEKSLAESKTFDQLVINLALVGNQLVCSPDGISPDLVELLARRVKDKGRLFVEFIFPATRQKKYNARSILEDLAFNVNMSKHFSTSNIINVIDIFQRLYIYAWNNPDYYSSGISNSMSHTTYKKTKTILQKLWPALIERISISFK